MDGLTSTQETEHGRSPVPVVLLAFALLAVAPGLLRLPSARVLANDALADGRPTFAEVVDVRVVNVEVVVTDGGKRVTDLTVDDFELLIDGKAVPIDFFTEVRGGKAAATAKTTASTGQAAAASLVAGREVGTHYLVFIDDFFAMPTHRDRVLRAMQDQVDQLKASDRMAIVAYNGRRIDLLSGWTGSSEELSEAFDLAMDRNAYGLRRMSELRRLGGMEHSAGGQPAYSARSSFSSIGFLGSGRAGTGSKLQPGQDVVSRVDQVVRASAGALRGFAHAPDGASAGRKVMLLLSGGWPLLTTEWADVLAGAGRAGSPQIVSGKERLRIFEPLIDTANRLGFTLYPVDLQPPGISHVSAAEFSTPEAARRGLARHGALQADSRDALFAIAEATGGRSFENSASSRLALGKVIEDTQSYYWLGFSPQWRGDDKSHRVKVRVRRKGSRVRSRTSFADLSRRSDVDLMVEGAQLFDQPLPGEGILRAELGEPLRAGRGRVRVPLRLTIPLDSITLLPGQSGYSASLELRVAARDLDGLMADMPLSQFEVRRPEAAKAGDMEVHELVLRLRAKPHHLIVALYNPVTGNILSQRLKFEI